ncbi:MAG: response regulator [Terricaulis sp.]
MAQAQRKNRAATATTAFVADNDPRTVATLVHTLELMGLSVDPGRSMGDIAEMMQAARDSSPPDVIFMDLHWQTQMKSLQLLKRGDIIVENETSFIGAIIASEVIRAQDALANVPIILCSDWETDTQAPHIKTALAAGPAAFFEKKDLDEKGGERRLHQLLSDLGVRVGSLQAIEELATRVTRKELAPVIKKLAAALGLKEKGIKALLYTSPERENTVTVTSHEKTRLNTLLNLAVALEEFAGDEDSGEAAKAKGALMAETSIAERLDAGGIEAAEYVLALIECRLGGPVR